MNTAAKRRPIEYGIYSIVWCVITMVWYKGLLFRCVGDLSYEASKKLIIAMAVISILVCAFFFSDRVSVWNVAVSLLIPYGTFTAMGYWHTAGYVRIAITAGAVLALIYDVLVMSRRIRRRRYIGKIVKRRIYRCIKMDIGIMAAAMIVVMAPMGSNVLFGSSLFYSNVKAVPGQAEEGQTIAGNIDTVSKLREEEWSTLSTMEKLNVLQCVANIEANYLGLSNELNVAARNLEEHTLAAYDDSRHSIYINVEYLENAGGMEALEACCHEAYHSYQHRQVDAYMEADEKTRKLRLYNRAARYAEEFSSYIDGDEDYYAYKTQWCESDARDYAESAVEDYKRKI